MASKCWLEPAGGTPPAPAFTRYVGVDFSDTPGLITGSANSTRQDPVCETTASGRWACSLAVGDMAMNLTDGRSALGRQPTVGTGSLLASHLTLHVQSVTRS